MLGTLFALQITIAVAQEPSVKLRLIVNPANPVNSVEREFLADAFLKKTTRWPDGEAIHPFDQRVDSLVRRAFSDSILHRSVAAVRNYWQQRIFSGRGVPPAELESDEAVVRRVQGDRFAVGYVSERADAASVKIIGVR
ncbi:MAG TPA: hypothetical protein VHM70_03090 [Polyangiaceae bacterium]|nr:hypothetical protein [Polyangiaceae bacterium]